MEVTQLKTKAAYAEAVQWDGSQESIQPLHEWLTQSVGEQIVRSVYTETLIQDRRVVTLVVDTSGPFTISLQPGYWVLLYSGTRQIEVRDPAFVADNFESVTV